MNAPVGAGHVPPIITNLAASVGVTEILKWRDEDDHYVVIASDGRKFTFKKLDPAKPRREQTTADVHEHVGESAPNVSRRGVHRKGKEKDEPA